MVKTKKLLLSCCITSALYMPVVFADTPETLNTIPLPNSAELNRPVQKSGTLNIPNSQKNQDGSFTISGSSKGSNTTRASTINVPRGQANPDGSIVVQGGNVNRPVVSSNISIPNSQVNSDGSITIQGGVNNRVVKDNVVNQGKVGGVSATIGKAQAQGGGGSTVDLEALQNQVQNGQVDLPKMEYKGGDNNGGASKNSTVITFKGGEQGYQVHEEEKNQPDKPQRVPVPEAGGGNYNSSIGPIPLPSARSLPLPALPVLANGVPTPNAAVTPLPPLPGMSNNANLPPLPNMTGMIGIPNSTPVNPDEYNTTLNSNTTGAAIDYTGRSIALPDTNSKEDQIEGYWANLMQEQANALMAKGAPIKIAIVQSNNVLLRRFVIQGLLKSDDSRVSKIDTGLFPVMSQSYIDGKITPTCYLLFDRKNLTVFNDEELKPLTKATNEKITASFVVGHMAAHCMDQFERSKVIPLKDLWYPNDLAKYGVQPSAFRRIFYMRMSPSLYFSKQTALFDDIAQRQYEERLADSFGILWAISNYNTATVTLPNAVIKLRQHLSESHSHYTLPAIRMSTLNAKSLNGNKLSDLWKQARNVQFLSGISSSLNDNAPKSVVSAEQTRELKGSPGNTKKDYTYTVGEEGKTIRKFGERHPTNSFNAPKNFKETNNPFSN